MKKIILSLLLGLMLPVYSFAVNRLQIVINYADGIYRGYSYDRVIEDEEDFIIDRPRYEGRFMENLMDTYKGTAYITTETNNKDEVVYIDIIKVTSKGDVDAEVTFRDQTQYFTNKGGTFGSFLNLFGDGMASFGKNLAKWLNKISKS